MNVKKHLFALGLAAVIVSPAMAADDILPPDATSAFSITGSAALTTEYFFRGFSQSNDSPSVSAGLNLNYKFSDMVTATAGIWSASVDAGTANGDIELDYIAGLAIVPPMLPDLTINPGFTYYSYPGSSNIGTVATANEEDMMRNLWVWLCVTMLAVALGGCGHTDEEMATKQREIDKLSADLKAAKAQIADDQAKFSEASNSIDKMKEQLKAAGLGLEKSKEDAARLAQALAEYKQRADQLAVIEQRFRELRSKLDKLNAIGVKVVPRNNRLVIQLPGDILFDSGKDDLKATGKEVLGQVAEVIRGDKDLMNRYFLVAGHTDNVKYPPGGVFKDNWLLSLARARQVLLFLVGEAKAADPKNPKATTGGGLNPARWAAAGYGEFQPIEEGGDEQTRRRNRRIELKLTSR